MAEWGPWENFITTMPCWKNSRHMLCNFHAMLSTFFEQIYPKLPNVGQGKNRNLTVEGKHYGALIVNVLDAASSLPSLTDWLGGLPL